MKPALAKANAGWNWPEVHSRRYHFTRGELRGAEAIPVLKAANHDLSGQECTIFEGLEFSFKSGFSST